MRPQVTEWGRKKGDFPGVVPRTWSGVTWDRVSIRGSQPIWGFWYNSVFWTILSKRSPTRGSLFEDDREDQKMCSETKGTRFFHFRCFCCCCGSHLKLAIPRGYLPYSVVSIIIRGEKEMKQVANCKLQLEPRMAPATHIFFFFD